MASPSILIIDDNAGDLELWAAALEDLHLTHVFAFASDGRHALRLITDRSASGDPFKLVICDQALPGFTGAEVYRNMASDPKLRGIAFVMMTGTLNPSLLAQVDCPWYEKPLNFADFKETALKILRKFPEAFPQASRTASAASSQRIKRQG